MSKQNRSQLTNRHKARRENDIERKVNRLSACRRNREDYPYRAEERLRKEVYDGT